MTTPLQEISGQRTIEKISLQTFPKTSQRRRRRDVLRQSVPQSGSGDRISSVADGWKASTSDCAEQCIAQDLKIYWTRTRSLNNAFSLICSISTTCSHTHTHTHWWSLTEGSISVYMGQCTGPITSLSIGSAALSSPRSTKTESRWRWYIRNFSHSRLPAVVLPELLSQILTCIKLPNYR